MSKKESKKESSASKKKINTSKKASNVIGKEKNKWCKQNVSGVNKKAIVIGEKAFRGAGGEK